MFDAVTAIAQATPQADGLAQYGILGVVSSMFVLAIVHLWRTSREDRKAEREQWTKQADEREKLVAAHHLKQTELAEASFERLKEIADDFAVRIKEERDANRAHEDAMRKEFQDVLTHIAGEYAKGNAATVAVMEKMYDRFLGPRAH